jgi:signal peptidase II
MQERRAVEALSPEDAGPPSPRRRRLAVTGCVAALAIVADQVTKSVALVELRNGPVHVLGPFSLQLEYNSGVAFSIAPGATFPIVVLAIVVIGGLIAFARHLPSLPAAVAIGLVLGGALGNLSDRLFRAHGGAVVDFVHSTFWPTFNVADSCIVCGGILLGLVLLRRPREEAVPGDEPARAPAPPGEQELA